MSSHRTVPPAYTQTEFNQLLADFDDHVDGAILDGQVTAAKLAMKIQAPYKYFVYQNGSVYEALDENGDLVFGGATDEGSVNGNSSISVANAAIAATTYGTVILHGALTFAGQLVLSMPTNQYTSIVFDSITVTTDENAIAITRVSGNGQWLGSITGRRLACSYPSYTKYGVALTNISYGTVNIGVIIASAWGTADSAGVAVICTDGSIGAYKNTVIVGGTSLFGIGLLVQSSGTGWVTVNKFNQTFFYATKIGLKEDNSGANVSGNVYNDLAFEWTDTNALGAPFGAATYGYIIAGNANFYSCSTIDVADADFVDVQVGSGGTARFFGGQLAHGNFDQNLEGSLITQNVNGITDTDMTGLANLVAYYPFDEGSGTNVVDYSGNGNHATFNSASYTTASVYGYSAFTGDGSHYAITNALNTHMELGGGDFTVTSWLKYNNQTSGTDRVVWRIDAEGATPREIVGLKVNIASLQFTAYTVSMGAKTTSPNVDASDGEWHFVVCVRKGDYLGLYVDAELEASITGVTTFDYATGKKLVIGRLEGTDSGYFEGDIDDLRFYNEFKNVAQQKELMARGALLHA